MSSWKRVASCRWIGPKALSELLLLVLLRLHPELLLLLLLTIFTIAHVCRRHMCTYTDQIPAVFILWRRRVFQRQTHVLLYFQCLCSCRGSDVGTGTYSATASPCLFKTTGFNWRQRTISWHNKRYPKTKKHQTGEILNMILKNHQYTYVGSLFRAITFYRDSI